MQRLITCMSCFTLLHPQPFLSKQTVVFIRLLLEKGNRIIGLCLGCIEPFFSFCSIITTVYINWSFNKSPSNLHSRCSLRLGTVWDHHGFHRQFCVFFIFSLLLCFILFSTGAQERNNCVGFFLIYLVCEGTVPPSDHSSTFVVSLSSDHCAESSVMCFSNCWLTDCLL